MRERESSNQLTGRGERERGGGERRGEKDGREGGRPYRVKGRVKGTGREWEEQDREI